MLIRQHAFIQKFYDQGGQKSRLLKLVVWILKSTHLDEKVPYAKRDFQLKDCEPELSGTKS